MIMKYKQAIHYICFLFSRYYVKAGGIEEKKKLKIKRKR